MTALFKKMKIGKKLLVSFLAVTILSSFSGIFSLYLLKSSDKDYSYALNTYGFSQGDIGVLKAALKEQAISILSVIASSDPAVNEKAKATAEQCGQIISDSLTSLQNTLTTPEEQKALQIISENLPLFTEHALEVVELSKINPEEAMELYRQEATEHLEIIENTTDDLLNANIAAGTALSKKLSHSTFLTIIFMLGVIIIALILSVSVAIYISRSIAIPMEECSKRLADLTNGDLTSPVHVIDSEDEIGVLSSTTNQLMLKLQALISEISNILKNIADGNLNIPYTRSYGGDFASLHTSTSKIIDSLNQAFQQIRESANLVSDSSDQVSTGSQALSQGATEQASSVEELASTINDITEQVNKNAANAEMARNKTQHVGNEMAVSNRNMKEMVDAMQKINDSSSEIGKIIKTIEDIAFQTNILALNAAVEAARAGSAGKGFAVVADEVRNLASKSAEASKSTSSLIENSIRAVEEGNTIVERTAASLSAAETETKEVIEAVNHISEAAVEQANALNQVTIGVDQISSVIQTNSATAEESAAASEELSGQAQILKDLIGNFQLKN